ncbi:hypothetical protein HGRIS_002792 [Hohenbuehelia grisea]|uniref:Tyrosinase copper-binding domain-containing protein n=1 Tax=Hohenbuehelia grisea TaxID=104357 RepID=A0ABR3JLH4_9AGAR
MYRLSCIAVWLTLLLQTFVAAESHTCTNPAVRREWRSLSRAERAEWVRAVKCLTKLPNTKVIRPTAERPDDIPPLNTTSSYYDDLVYMHMDLNHLVHFTGLFLPWHRYYVHVYEIAMKKSCGYTGVTPYWDWTLDAHDIFGSSFWNDPDPLSGLGSFGKAENGYEVRDGAFAAPNYIRPYPWPHGIRRMYNLRPYSDFPVKALPDRNIMANTTYSPQAVEKLLNSHPGNFMEFQRDFEKIPGAHPSVHGTITGYEQALRLSKLSLSAAYV